MTVTDFLLSHKISTTSMQRATALREKVSALLSEDPDCKVISSSQAQVTRDYSVEGVETTSKKVFREKVEAKDPTEAEASVVGSSKAKVVVRVEALS